ncbi:MAG: GNAT family N-acetyltransferase [Thermoanaerobaculia bacterium]
MQPSDGRGLRVRLLTPDDSSALADYLRRAAEATIFHRVEWHEAIRETYGHACYYWAAFRDGRLDGLFPVVLVRHRVLGSKLIALPYQFFAGSPVADQDSVRQALIEHAVEHAREVGADFLEVRHRRACPLLEELGFAAIDSHLVNSTASLADLSPRKLRKTRRQDANYCLRRGVAIDETTAEEDLDGFHRLYTIEGRALGAPRSGRWFFRNLSRNLGSRMRLFVARSSDKRMLGGFLTIDDSRTMFARCAASPGKEAAGLRVHKALLWRAMVAGAESGCEAFNFGITWVGDTGLIQFKEQWLGRTAPVHQYVLPLRRDLPRSPGNYFSGYATAKAIWRRLPLPLAERLGAAVTRWIC